MNTAKRAFIVLVVTKLRNKKVAFSINDGNRAEMSECKSGAASWGSRSGPASEVPDWDDRRFVLVFDKGGSFAGEYGWGNSYTEGSCL